MPHAGSLAYRERRIPLAYAGDFATDRAWIATVPRSGLPHELRISKYPFSEAQGVTCERGLQCALTEG